MSAEAQLWTHAREGDREAFGLLFEQHARLIYNYFFRRVGDWAAAEDLLSIAFLEAWRCRKTLSSPEKGLPWLYGIANNVVRNRRRSERRYAAALRRVPEPRPEPDLAVDAIECLEEDRNVKAALALVSKLPAREQEVFVLCTGFDVSYDDAAFALQIPVGTVRSRLSRARRRIGELKAEAGTQEEEGRRERRDGGNPHLSHDHLTTEGSVER